MLVRRGTVADVSEGAALPHGRQHDRCPPPRRGGNDGGAGADDGGGGGGVRLALIVDGAAAVRLGGRAVAWLDRGDFVGELNLAHDDDDGEDRGGGGGAGRIDVRATRRTRYIYWNGDALDELFVQQPAVRHAIEHVWNTQVYYGAGLR